MDSTAIGGTCDDHRANWRRSDRRGFTLIELLIAVAIIGVLAGLLIPAVGMVRERAHTNTCLSNLRQIGMGVTYFAMENDGCGPGAALNPHSVSWANILDREVWAGEGVDNGRFGKSVGDLACPSVEAWGTTRYYAYNGGATQGAELPDPTQRDPKYTKYRLGILLERIKQASQKILIKDWRRGSDTFGVNWPAGTMKWGSGGKPPYTAFDGMWTFRHNGRSQTCLLFADIHVGTHGKDPELNSAKYISVSHVE